MFFSKDEGLTETNLSKPRMYIENFGTEPLSGFYCYYYFTVEGDKTPVLEDYYTPDADVTLEDITNGNYRVKFSFPGITINPGNILPNLDGEVVGLHYSDWSAWDKTNDLSNTGLSTFSLNGNMPVYSSSDTLIYGNLPADTANPPQPPSVSTNTGDYAVLSKEYTDIRDRVVIKGGNVGSAVYTEVGANAVVNGSVLSGGSMFLRSNDTIKGNATAAESVNTQNDVVVTGTIRSHAQLEIPQKSIPAITAGTTDITVANDSACELQPGTYKDFHAYSRATVTLHAGTYTFNSFIVEPDVSIKLDISDIERINVNVVSELRFADRTNMTFEHDTAYPYSIKICSAQTTQLTIGTDCKIYGYIISPDAEIHVYSRTEFNGALYGRKVVVEPDAIICKPPLLQDLSHSEWAFAPSFDPTVFDYKTVVSDATNTLTISTIVSNGTIITVNGESPSGSVNLAETITNVKFALSNSDQCGTTVYNLKVIKDANYQIFVNDDSPCLSGLEDGNSWSTAYKDLQQAINKAFVEGKEIWVAEGTYKPSIRTDSANPRSATFMVYSGIEIIGSFKGSETENEPSGSPYKTILSGDLTGNDSLIAAWPPSGDALNYISDNAYHVVTITGNSQSSAVKFSGFMVKHGIADSSNENSYGGGIYVKGCNPTLQKIGICENIADSSGAGIYVKSNIKSIENCLFTDNYSRNGNGAGLYLNGDGELDINASIFDGNTTQDSSSLKGGSALYFDEAQIIVVDKNNFRNS